MSSKEKYMLLKTYYEKEEVERILHKLDTNNIAYQVNNKSNITNFRIPHATFVEIDLLISRT